jgi:Holliday junction resolvase RusA-like endonuclease
MRQILENLTLPYFSDMSTRVTLGITFRCRRPDHHFVNADRSKAIKTAFRNSRETGGDVDNMVKFVMDAGTDVLYTDDRQVTCLYATKMWHESAASLGFVTVAVKLHHYM